MKFVHLSEQPSIARNKKSGIRCGAGRRGRGVYAESHLQSVREAHEFKPMATLQVTVHSAVGLGAVLHGLRIHDYAVSGDNDESINVVFVQPIQARSIGRAIPQYRSNKPFKQLKGCLN